MHKHSLVSVVIPCYNGGQYISEAIKSVLYQTHKNIECIIVDDGSTDNSKVIIEHYRKKDSRIQYFYKNNGGACSARNFGISQATGDWIQFLDADDWLYEDKLEKQLEAVKARNDSTNNIIIYSDWHMAREGDDGILHFKEDVVVGDLSVEQLIKWYVGNKPPYRPPPFHTSSTLISKDILKRHRFDENLPALQDPSFYYKILNDNIKLLYVPIKSMCYRKNKSGISSNKYSFVKGYAGYLETIYSVNKNHLAMNYRYWTLLKDSVKFKDKDIYNRLLFILYNSKIPVYVSIKGKFINVRSIAIVFARLHLLSSVIKTVNIHEGLIKKRVIKRMFNMYLKIVKTISRKIFVRIGVIINRCQNDIAAAMLPEFANKPKKLRIRLPWTINKPERIYFGDEVELGPNCWLFIKTKFQEPKAPEQEQRERIQTFSPTISIGNRVRCRGGLQIAAMDKIVIEDDVIIAYNVFMSDGSHGYYTANEPYRYQMLQNIKPITVKKGCLIGQNVVLLPGVEIGEYCIIGANSVVTKSIPPRSIAAGIPARVVKQWDNTSQQWISATHSDNGKMEEIVI